MNFWRAILASLLSLVCTVAVSGFITLQTVNSTLLDRSEVQTWLAQSGVYSNLLTTLLSSNPATEQQLSPAGSSISRDTVKTALVQTLPPSFVRQSTEYALDSAYNWLDGKQSTIQFEINATGYKEAFVQNLAAQLEPQLAAMPRCNSLSEFNSADPTCLPPGTTAAQAANSIAIDASNRIGLFDRPFNTQNLSDLSQSNNPSSPTPASPSTQLPEIIKLMRMWLLWLPAIALLSGSLMVLLSQHKLKAAKHLAGRLTFGLAVACALGLAVAYFGRDLKLTSYIGGSSTAVTANLAEPILHQAAPAIGNYLALVSGIAGTLTLAVWVTLRVIKKRQDKARLLTPPENEPAASTPKPPVAPEPPTPTPSKPQGQTDSHNAPDSRPR